MTLEERIRTAIKSGSFLHLSINRKWDDKEIWQCGYRNADNCNVQYVEDADPIRAMEKAITPLRLPKPPRAHLPIARQVKTRRQSEDLI